MVLKFELQKMYNWILMFLQPAFTFVSPFICSSEYFLFCVCVCMLAHGQCSDGNIKVFCYFCKWENMDGWCLLWWVLRLRTSYWCSEDWWRTVSYVTTRGGGGWWCIVFGCSTGVLSTCNGWEALLISEFWIKFILSLKSCGVSPPTERVLPVPQPIPAAHSLHC